MANGREASHYVLESSITKLVHVKARRAVSAGHYSQSDYPDLIQEVFLALLKYGKKDDLQSVKTICNWCITSTLRNRYYPKRSPLRECKVKDIDTIKSNRQRTSTLSARELFELQFDTAMVIRSLPGVLRDICCRLIAGQPKMIIARELRMSQNSLTFFIADIRDYFERAGMRNYL